MQFILFISVLMVNSFHFTNSLALNQTCITPNEFRGNCVKFHECQSLYELYRKNRENPEDRRFISLSHCGYADGHPLVCCRDAFVNSPRMEEPIIPITQAPSFFLLPRPGDGTCGIYAEPRIHYPGPNTLLDEQPWTALLGYTNTETSEVTFNCGGILISKQYVLTSASCTGNLPQNFVLSHVRLGEWEIGKDSDCEDVELEKICAPPPVDIPIEKIIPREDSSAHKDLALLRLSKSADLTDFVKLSCLPILAPEAYDRFENQTLVVTGWGSSKIKLKGYIEGVSNLECNNFYSGLNLNGDSHICAGRQKSLFNCNVRSGSPLMAQNSNGNPPYWFVAGIFEHGSTQCDLGQDDYKPGVYIRVGEYTSWIESQIKF